jgi:hypothetical protein
MTDMNNINTGVDSTSYVYEESRSQRMGHVYDISGAATEHEIHRLFDTLTIERKQLLLYELNGQVDSYSSSLYEANTSRMNMSELEVGDVEGDDDSMSIDEDVDVESCIDHHDTEEPEPEPEPEVEIDELCASLLTSNESNNSQYEPLPLVRDRVMSSDSAYIGMLGNELDDLGDFGDFGDFQNSGFIQHDDPLSSHSHYNMSHLSSLDDIAMSSSFPNVTIRKKR